MTRDTYTHPITTVGQWMVEAKQLPRLGAFDARRSAFQLGMQLEELAEKIDCLTMTSESPLNIDSAKRDQIRELTNLSGILQHAADQFKAGMYEARMQAAWEHDPKDLLDSDIDLMWVTAGAICAQTPYGMRAWGKVVHANYAKFTGGVNLDRNGKVVKPPGWQAPDLSDCVACRS